MGDENFAPATGGFLMMESGGEPENIGYIGEDGIPLASDGMDVWQGRPLGFDQVVTITLKPHWWLLNRLYKIVTGRYRYTVPTLRRWNKGHRRNKAWKR